MAKGRVYQTDKRRNKHYPWEFQGGFSQFQLWQHDLNLVAYPTRHKKKKPRRNAKGFSTISIS